MSATDSPERLRVRMPGRLSKAITRLLMKRVTIVASERLTDRFWLITLEGLALRDVAWAAGQKVQIAMGSAFVARTYTPLEYNASTGRMCILGYAHGEGPGSMWVRTSQPGDTCDLFGPRALLDLRALPGPLALFGDETAIGLAYAAIHQDPTRSVTCHFEVDDVEGARRTTTQLGMDDAMLFARRPDDAHVTAMEAAFPPAIAAGATFVLAGKAGSIQRLRQSLRAAGVPATRLVAKAYWAPGKTGLD